VADEVARYLVTNITVHSSHLEAQVTWILEQEDC